MGRPLWLQGPIPIFFLILPMVPLEVPQLIASEAPSGLHLLGSHSLGHFHLEDRIIRYGLLQIAGDEQPFVIFMGQLITITSAPSWGEDSGRLGPSSSTSGMVAAQAVVLWNHGLYPEVWPAAFG